jgi:hypothetical protein
MTKTICCLKKRDIVTKMSRSMSHQCHIKVTKMSPTLSHRERDRERDRERVYLYHYVVVINIL